MYNFTFGCFEPHLSLPHAANYYINDFPSALFIAPLIFVSSANFIKNDFMVKFQVSAKYVK